jgi:PKD repeat protein
MLACVGEAVKFINASYNSDLIDYTWTFPADADISTSNVKDPTVTFSSPGWKTITLKAENANGSNSYTSTEAVYIQTGDALPEGPYFEAFNSSSVVNDWIGFNYDRNNSKWSYAANTGKGGNGCMKVELYKSLPGDIDEIITPVMDLTSTSTQTISFDYSLATMNQNYLSETSDAKRDSIVVYASKNCGLTWTPVLRKGGPTIVNAGILEGSTLYTGYYF